VTRRGAPPLLVALAGAAWLAGCGGGDTCRDPARAGFVGGLGNLASGCYAREEGRLGAELAAARARRDALQAEAASLEERARLLDGERRSLVLRLAATGRELAGLSAQLDTLSRRGAVGRAELGRLRAQEATLAGQLRRAGGAQAGPGEAEIVRLEAENAGLRTRIQGLLGDLEKAVR
jgi:chromosome segregation ATPase